MSFPIKIMSWNILASKAYNKYTVKNEKSIFHKKRWLKVLSNINYYKPDILLLQEADKNFTEWLIKKLNKNSNSKWTYVSCHTKSLTPNKWQSNDFGSCIIYKSATYNIIERGIIIDDKYEKYGWKDAVYIKIKINNQNCFIASLHLSGSNKKASTNLFKDVLKKSKNNKYKIIGGDFNCDMSGISEINQFKKCRSDKKSKKVTTCDFDYINEKDKPMAMEVDKILISKTLRKKKYKIIQTVNCKKYTLKKKRSFIQKIGSDHYPIIAKITNNILMSKTKKKKKKRSKRRKAK